MAAPLAFLSVADGRAAVGGFLERSRHGSDYWGHDSYDADGGRVKRVNGSTTIVYLGGLWEETTTGATKSYYTFNGQVVAVRDSGGVTYLHSDHLGSMSVATDANAVGTPQYFDPWGKRRGTSSITQTASKLALPSAVNA